MTKTENPRFLDITGDVCPITFVRTKLELERMRPGEILDLRLNAGEPLENVPRSVMEQGDILVDTMPDPTGVTGVFCLRIRKS